MTVIRSIVGIWKSYEETTETPKIPELKTRYYNKSREKLIEAIQTIINKNKLDKWKISRIDSERGEINLEKGASTMVITVYRLNPIKSAIDVYCSKEGPIGDFGSSYRHILEFFSALHTEVQPEGGK